jgi:hypothetical protein
MRSSLVRTAVVTSLLTALVVTAGAMFIAPRFMNPATSQNDSALQPAMYQGAASNDPQLPTDQPATSATPRLHRRPSAAVRRVSAPEPAPAETASYSDRDSYGEPVHKHRSTAKSALIVAGSAGTGAAIGAIAGGGKGAGIGALAGGAAGLVYDRLTANK